MTLALAKNHKKLALIAGAIGVIPFVVLLFNGKNLDILVSYV